MIPDKSNEAWKKIIQGKIDHKFSSFSLQMKVNFLQRGYKNGLLKMDEAIDDLYQLCEKFEKIYADDINKIFNIK